LGIHVLHWNGQYARPTGISPVNSGAAAAFVRRKCCRRVPAATGYWESDILRLSEDFEKVPKTKPHGYYSRVFGPCAFLLLVLSKVE